MRYVVRHGRRIAVETLNGSQTPKKRTKQFEAEWVQFPMRWIETLWQSRRTSTWKLASRILSEKFKRRYLGGEIILSSKVTKMPRPTRLKAARELVKLGLIKTEQAGREAVRVSDIYHFNEKKRKKREEDPVFPIGNASVPNRERSVSNRKPPNPALTEERRS